MYAVVWGGQTGVCRAAHANTYLLDLVNVDIICTPEVKRYIVDHSSWGEK